MSLLTRPTGDRHDGAIGSPNPLNSFRISQGAEIRRKILRSLAASRGGGTRTHTTLRSPDFKSGKLCCRVSLDLAKSPYLRPFSSPAYSILLNVALPVVSEWCQFV